MQKSFDANKLMDIIAICGVYITLGTMINSWGLELDDFIDVPAAAGEENWPDT